MEALTEKPIAQQAILFYRVAHSWQDYLQIRGRHPEAGVHHLFSLSRLGGAFAQFFLVNAQDKAPSVMDHESCHCGLSFCLFPDLRADQCWTACWAHPNRAGPQPGKDLQVCHMLLNKEAQLRPPPRLPFRRAQGAHLPGGAEP